MLLLIGEDDGTTSDPGYASLGPGRSLSFEGFTYCIREELALMGSQVAFFGGPGACAPGDAVAQPDETIDRDVVDRYIAWRLANGMPVD